MIKKNLFLRYFPTPDFLKMPSVGLDISDGSIRFVELIDYRGKKILNRFGRVDLPENVVLKGNIVDKKKLVEILKKLKSKYDFSFVRISVIENNSYIFKTKIPVMENTDKDSLKGSLSFKLEENVPFGPDESIFDFDIIKWGEKNIEVVVSVLPKKIVSQLIDVFDEAGLTLLSLEVEAQAITRSIIPYGDDQTFMIVDFRNTRTGISIVSDGVVQLTSTVDVGGDNLVNAIEKHLGVSKREAQRIKNDRGFVKQDSKDDLFYAMMNSISVLKDEMNKYLFYWNSHKENSKKNKLVKKIILCGENGVLRGLDDYFSLSMKLNVEKADVWKNVLSIEDFVPEMTFRESLEYTTAIGLAMRTDEEIYLLENFKKQNV